MHGIARALLKKLRKIRFPYVPLIEVKISRGTLLQNLRAFQNLNKKVAVAPVLKSNAYGHGLVEVAQILDGEHLPFLCVDSYFEALILRNEGIHSPTLILGYTSLENIRGNQLSNVAFGIINLESLQRLSKHCLSRTAIHLKIDTGMHRHGIAISEVDEAVTLIRANKHIVLAGVYSHLADADTPRSQHTEAQIREWNKLVEKIRSEFPEVRYFHCANSAGAAHGDRIHANVMRLGIGLYGINPIRNSPPGGPSAGDTISQMWEIVSPTYPRVQNAGEISNGVNPSPARMTLRPALEMITRITSTRTLKKGEAVGYNATFTAPRDMRIASIPVGYYEGIDRRLSNKGTVMIRNTLCPIIGRVSMNITSVDVSHLPDIKLDEPVTAISSRSEDLNSIENIARACSTIPYEILVKIPAHLRRVVVA